MALQNMGTHRNQRIESPRVRRLQSDYRALEQLRNESTIFDFEATGPRSERYELRFQGTGLWRPRDHGSRVELDRWQYDDDGVVMRTEHRVHVELGAAYPRMMPALKWLTPIFHPNISASGVVCLGEYGTHWAPSLNLAELCRMLWDMIRYANYDIDSPYNREAACWARSQTTFDFPVDRRSLRDRIASVDATAERPPQIAAATASRSSDSGDSPVVIDAEVVVEEDAVTDEIVFLDE